ncbi:MAG: hypothetical protein IH597_11910 [Bacteroidales bacterium]|nr:hypothetical protein [Bacteroidales bacterium]
MNLAEKTLETLQTKGIFVDVFTDHYDESFFGFIRVFNNNFILLENYSDDGFYNGVIIFRRQDITRIRWGNNEIKSASKIITRQEQIKELADISVDSIESIIKSIDKAFGYVSLQIQDINSAWTIIGQLQEMDSETIVIKEFGTMSTLDRGMLMLSIADITRVDAGGLYENNLMKIHGKNN